MNFQILTHKFKKCLGAITSIIDRFLNFIYLEHQNNIYDTDNNRVLTVMPVAPFLLPGVGPLVLPPPAPNHLLISHKIEILPAPPLFIYPIQKYPIYPVYQFL